MGAGLMPPDGDCKLTVAQARRELKGSVMSAFCKVLHQGELSPIAVLTLLAEAVGAAYREVAEAHSGENACPCPWRPDMDADMAALQAAMLQLALEAEGFDLELAEPAGRA